MKRRYDSIRIFQSSFCEFFTHVHPITPLIIWAPVSGFFLWRAFTFTHLSAASVFGLAFMGFIFWTLAEYLLHRFVFHFSPGSPIEEKFQFIIHGLHHADPVDPTRLVMPPFASVILAVIFYSIFFSVLGPRATGSFFGGFIVGYLCYDYIHYAVHHFTPRTRLGKFLKQSHMIHHFVSHDARWGVSSPLWDYVFGTADAPESVRHGS
jgi:sterol desaturase/sphingolipid hydroxylase (fatty acid hydroxylase superfamily)